MNRAFKPKSKAPIHAKYNHIVAVDGSIHPFTVGSERSRKMAINAAQDAGDIHLATLEAQKGAPLSKSEIRSGTHDAPPAEPAKPVSLKKPPADDVSKIAAARDSVANSRGHTPAERAEHDRRLKAMNKALARAELRKQDREAQAAYLASPEVQQMIAHAAANLDAVTGNVGSTPQAVRDARRLWDLTSSSNPITPEVYRQLATAAGFTPPAPNRSAGISQPGAMLGDAQAKSDDIGGAQ
ncbi:MAG TPA: hypothetical protein VHV55_14665 [Pirellulales bacterium]|jgi:hypothetical protein|nr:hypothetical protein [Pirellulales bacterium]